MADVFSIEGSDRLVLELMMFGFAQESRWILLRPSIRIERFADAGFASDVGMHPSKYGRVLRFDVDLFRDDDGSLHIELH